MKADVFNSSIFGERLVRLKSTAEVFDDTDQPGDTRAPTAAPPKGEDESRLPPELRDFTPFSKFPKVSATLANLGVLEQRSDRPGLVGGS